jgi:hypothetical protein
VPVDLSGVAGRHGRVLLRGDLSWRTDRGLTRLPDQPLSAYVTDHLMRNPGRRHTELSDYRADALRERPAPGRRPVPVCPHTYYVEDMAGHGPFGWRVRSELACFGRHPAAGDGFQSAFRRGRRPRVEVTWTFPLLLSAIDPVTEAKLTGLDRSLTAGRYFAAREGNRWTPARHGYRDRLMPVLVANRSSLDLHADLRVERLANAAAQGMLRRHWSTRHSLAVLRYLKDQSAGRVVARHGLDAGPAYARLQRAMRNPYFGAFDGRIYRPGPTVYRHRAGTLVPRPQPRPVAGVWGYTYAYIGGPVPPADQDRALRRLTSVPPTSDPTATVPTLSYRGTFDPARLRVPHGPGAAPETVFARPALRPRDARSARLLGGRRLVPDGNLAGYLAEPPGLITTLRAARVFTSDVYPQVVGDPPISAVRVRVAGVTGIDALSRERIREAAQRIATATGLEVDIMAGASGTPTPVDLPAGEFGRPRLALSELWIRKGVATRVLAAVDRKSLVLFTLILVVCALFVANATSAAVRARRSELGVLSSLGWSTGRLFAVVLAEVGAIGLAAGVLGGALALPLAALVGVGASLARAAIAVPAATLLALLAGLVPALRAARAEPLAAVRPPVLEARRAWHPRTLRGLALVNLLRTPGRTALGALGLAIGVGALTLLLAATLAFHDTLVGTLLGDAVAVEIRGSDYVAVAATVLLGLAAVTDVLFLNLRERSAELATLTASGWHDGALARLLTFEGLWIGALGALGGAGVGLAAAAVFAGSLPVALLLTTAAAALAGTLLAGGAGLVPAAWLRRAVAIAQLAGE